MVVAVMFIRGKGKKKSLLNESPSVKDIKFLGQSTVFSWSYSLKQNEITACQIELFKKGFDQLKLKKIGIFKQRLKVMLHETIRDDDF